MLLSYLKSNIFEYKKKDFLYKLYEFNNKQTPLLFLEEKYHFKYLNHYFSKDGGLNAKFVFVERDYISKNYLTDYSNYYSTCFTDYIRKCTRLHYFNYKTDSLNSFIDDFVKGITAKESHIDNEFWKKYYLGFTVIDPIPNKFIGYTLLKHYNCFKEDENRLYWGIKTYNAHLFGKTIPIESLAFHEQDSNVGACATIAIWSVFQIASEDYYVNLK